MADQRHSWQRCCYNWSQCFRKDSVNKRWVIRLIYTNNTFSASWHNHSTISDLKYSAWVIVALRFQGLLISCIYRPPRAHQSEFLPLLDALYAATEFPAPKLLVGYFNATGIFAFFLFPKYLSTFVSSVRLSDTTVFITQKGPAGILILFSQLA